MRGRCLELEGVAPARIGADRRGRPVTAVQIEAAVLAVAAAAQLAIWNHRLMVAVGVGLVDTGPVVERLGAADGLGGGAGRVGRILRIALVALLHAAERLGQRAVGEGVAGQCQADNGGQCEDGPMGQMHAGTPLRSVGNLAESSHVAAICPSDKFERLLRSSVSATRAPLRGRGARRRCDVHRLPHHCVSTRSTHRARPRPRPAGRPRH